jgi:hypothetical protein
MTVGRSSDPFEQIMSRITALEEALQLSRQNPLRLPVVNADPDVDLGANVWLMEDGRLRVRNAAGTIKEYAPVGSPGGTTTTVPKPTPPAAKKTYVKTWAATWGQSYRQDNVKRTDTNHLYYGYGDSFNGRGKSLVGFNYSDIASNLSGATVTKVEIFFHQVHAWWSNGGYVRFGIHNNTVEPATYGGVVRTNVSSAHFGKPEYKWITVATEFGIRFRDGTGRGILIDQLTSDKAFYGYGAGINDSGYKPSIRITYVK